MKNQKINRSRILRKNHTEGSQGTLFYYHKKIGNYAMLIKKAKSEAHKAPFQTKALNEIRKCRKTT